ncbi:MAG: prepilin peptidase [Planctomycetes bacterium]|nr:prepilin peptidase [Planctomycetota bacterium]
MSPERIAFIVAVGGFVSLAAIIDFRTRRLPNALTVPACLLGLVFNLALGYFHSGWEGLAAGGLSSLGGFALGFGLLFVLWVTGGGGGGDVKFMGAVGAWVGPMTTLYVFLIGAVYVLLGSLVLRLTQRRETASPASTTSTRSVPARRQVMPWAVPIALAVWSVLLYLNLYRPS